MRRGSADGRRPRGAAVPRHHRDVGHHHVGFAQQARSSSGSASGCAARRPRARRAPPRAPRPSRSPRGPGRDRGRTSRTCRRRSPRPVSGSRSGASAREPAPGIDHLGRHRAVRGRDTPRAGSRAGTSGCSRGPRRWRRRGAARAARRGWRRTRPGRTVPALELGGHRACSAGGSTEDRHDRDHHQDREPRALGELRGGHDHQDDRGRDRADRVDHDGAAPLRVRRRRPCVPPRDPVLHHAGLRQRERGEHAHDVQLDQLR